MRPEDIDYDRPVTECSSCSDLAAEMAAALAAASFLSSFACALMPASLAAVSISIPLMATDCSCLLNCSIKRDDNQCMVK